MLLDVQLSMTRCIMTQLHSCTILFKSAEKTAWFNKSYNKIHRMVSMQSRKGTIPDTAKILEMGLVSSSTLEKH